MIPAVLSMTLVAFLGAVDRDLELPHLVVRGTVLSAAPLREFWPSPLGDSSMTGPIWDLPIPTSTQTRSRSLRRMNPSPPPAGFSVSAGGGPWSSGRFVAGLGDEKGGIAVAGWSYEGQEIQHKGIRGSALIAGRRGSLGLYGWRPYDEYEKEPLSGDWAYGELIGRFGIGHRRTLALRAYSTTAENDPGHVEGTLRGRLSHDEYGYELVAGDRLVGTHLQIDRFLDWLNCRVGATTVDADSTWKLKIDGEAVITPVQSDHLHLAFGLARHLRLRERAALKRAFVLMGIDQQAVLEDLDWQVEAWCTLRLSSDITVMARLGQRRFESFPLWYAEQDSLHWHAIPVAGSGLHATGMMHFSMNNTRISAGVAYEGLKREETDSVGDAIPGESIADTGPWPLLPPLSWWVELTYGRSCELRLRFERNTGRETLQGSTVESSTTARGIVSVPLSSMLCVWAEGAYSSGWEFDPWPTRALSVGLSWSLHGFTRQEEAF